MHIHTWMAAALLIGRRHSCSPWNHCFVSSLRRRKYSLIGPPQSIPCSPKKRTYISRITSIHAPLILLIYSAPGKRANFLILSFNASKMSSSGWNSEHTFYNSFGTSAWIYGICQIFVSPIWLQKQLCFVKYFRHRKSLFVWVKKILFGL